MKKYAIIVAGGSGSRMQSRVPKQFLMVEDQPILVKTLQKFSDAIKGIEIIVALPQNQLDRWNGLREEFNFLTNIKATVGGETRTASVMAGLSLIEGDGLVAIHDAVRPYVTAETIVNSFESAEKHGSGVAAVPLKDSIRELNPGKTSRALNRNNYVLVQTPQTFDIEKLKKAYAAIGTSSFTDDASVFENAGEEVHLVNGSYANIKITTPEDLR